MTGMSRVPSHRRSETNGDAHRFDEAALKAYLARYLPGFDGPMSVTRFMGGQSNPTFHIGVSGEEYVLRKKPPGKLLPSAHAVDREYRVLKALMNTDVPVPRVLHFCDRDEVIGTPFYVMEFLAGRILRDPLLPGMDAAERSAIYDAMNDTLARLHHLDRTAAGLEDFGKPDNYITRQVALWRRQYEASKTGDVPAMDRLMNWLPDHIPDDDSTSIVHGDFRLENLMFDEKEPRVIAVLDWELSTLGHPLSDLAFNCMTYYLPSDNRIARGFVGSDMASLGLPSEQDYVATYCKRTSRESIPDWPFFMAFSLFRTAAIQQGVYARALRGNASSETAHQFGNLYPLVAEQGWKLVKNLQ
jgi:aminoglycoside phosphotransferase (APT) family kinase protein